MNLFAYVKKQSIPEGFAYLPGGYITGNANFDNFGLSVMTMIRAVTGEQVRMLSALRAFRVLSMLCSVQFNGIMHSLTLAEPYCDPAAKWGDPSCGVTLATSALFWVVFYTVAALIHLHFLTALLLEGYVESATDTTDESGAYTLTHSAADAFTDLWAVYDVYSTQRLSFEDAARVVARLDAPLGLRRRLHGATASAVAEGQQANSDTVPPEEAQAFLRSLRLQSLKIGDEPGERASDVHFLPLLEALLDRASARPPLGHRHGSADSTGPHDGTENIAGAGALQLRDLSAAAQLVRAELEAAAEASSRAAAEVGASGEVSSECTVAPVPVDAQPTRGITENLNVL